MILGFDFMRYHVDFLHRTVRDFFIAEEMLALLKARSGPGFDARVALCRLSLAQFKALPDLAFSFPEESQISIQLMDMAGEVICYAREAEIHNNSPEFAILNELEHTLFARRQVPKVQFHDNRGPFRNLDREEFLNTIIRAGLCLYVAQKLDTEPELLGLKGIGHC